MTRIIICDDHEIVREAVARRLDKIQDVEVVGETDDGAGLLKVVERLEPDLVLMDLEMPKQNGLRTIVQLKKHAPEPDIIVLSAHSEPEIVETALGLGASGFLSKAASSKQMEAAIRTVTGGERYVGSAIEPFNEKTDEMKRLCLLTKRESEILELLATGMRAKGIATELDVEPATVYTHVRNAVGKLEVDTRTQAVAIVQRYAFLTKSDEAV